MPMSLLLGPLQYLMLPLNEPYRLPAQPEDALRLEILSCHCFTRWQYIQKVSGTGHCKQLNRGYSPEAWPWIGMDSLS